MSAPRPQRSSSAEQTAAAGARLAAVLSPGDVVLISGELGAGKTTFVRGALRAMGVEGPVTSPTYVIGQLHAARGRAVAHLDLYRLGGLDAEDPELLDAYFGPDLVSFVEWPEQAGAAPLELAGARVAWRVSLMHAGSDERTLEMASV